MKPDVKSYLLNLFNHLSGDHAHCLSPKCHIKHKNKHKEVCQTEEFRKEMEEIKQRMNKKLDRLPLDECTKGRSTAALEGLNNVTNKYACKRVDFKNTHEARVYSCINDWNEENNIANYKD